MRKSVFSYIEKKYKTSPEYPWAKDDRDAVFRHSGNRKWFALVMEVGKEKLGLSGDGYVDAINLKIDDRMFHDILTREPGIFPAYHMNKTHWNSVILDGTVPEKEIRRMIAESFDLTGYKKKEGRRKGP